MQKHQTALDCRAIILFILPLCTEVFLISLFVLLHCDIVLIHSQFYGAKKSHLTLLQNCSLHCRMKSTEHVVYIVRPELNPQRHCEKKSKDIH
jgi:hypothetical protein